MGGRGTFAVGNNVPYAWRTVGKISGVKVLQPIDAHRSFNMPPEAHSSSSYIVLDKTGVFRQYMEYNSGHLPVFELGYHYEKGLSQHGEPVLHYHSYSSPGIENRSPAKPITPEMEQKYKKYFKGVY